MRWLRERLHSTNGHFSVIWLLILLAGWIVIFHLIEVMAWGLLYFFTKSVPEFESAMYFSAVTYTTTGYGDVLLPKPWRLVCAVESLVGILMCGWSTGFFFNAVSRIYDFNEAQEKSKPQDS